VCVIAACAVVTPTASAAPSKNGNGVMCVLQAKLAAYVWLAAHLGAILQRRRQVQSERRVSDGMLLARLTDVLDTTELSHPLARSVVGLVNRFFQAWYRLSRAVITW